MKWKQKEYALKRIAELQTAKVNEARTKYTVNRKQISDSEKYDLIKKGKVSLFSKEKVLGGYHSYLTNWFDFSAYENDRYEKEEFKLVEERIQKTARGAKDQIVLGDCEEAMKLIKELEEIKV